MFAEEAIAQGHVWWADFLLLVAVVVSAVAAILSLAARGVLVGLGFVAAACWFLALLVT